LEGRWARLAVRAQCRGVLDYADFERNARGYLRERILLDEIEREQLIASASVMLLGQVALSARGTADKRQLAKDTLNMALELIMPADKKQITESTDPKIIEQAYKNAIEQHRKRKAKAK